MSDIVAFLNVRLDEDEAQTEVNLNKAALAIYNSATAHPRRKACEDFTTLPSLVQERYRALAVASLPTLARVLREVKAKRAIVELHEPEYVETINADGDERSGEVCTCCDEAFPCDTLKLMAAPDAEHADFNPAWAIAT